MKPAILLLFLFATIALGATDEPPIGPDDDIGPLVVPIMLMGLCIMLFLVGVRIVGAAVVAVCAAVMVALGIISSAALVGILRRRFSSGFRVFYYLLCAFVGLPAGVGALWLGSHLFSTHLRHRDIFLTGSIAGVFGGLLVAFTLERLTIITCRRFVTPIIPHARKPKPPGW